jgi:hypothetical protein
MLKAHKLIAYLFSGQGMHHSPFFCSTLNHFVGAQTVGMLKDAVSISSTTREMLEYSSSILKYNILDICSQGKL